MAVSISEKIETRVRFNEVDSLGIVWHGHYIRYFEDGREAFGSKYGLGYMDVFQKGFLMPIVNVQCDYKRSLRYGDTVIVETEYIPSAAVKLIFHFRLYNAETGELAASSSSTQVFVDKESAVLQLTNPQFFEKWKQKVQLIKR